MSENGLVGKISDIGFAQENKKAQKNDVKSSEIYCCPQLNLLR